MSRRWLYVGLLAAAGAGGWYALGRAPEAPAPVSATPAQPLGVGALGRIEPASRIRKLNQPGGMAVTRLDRLHVSEGEEVRAGQLLAEFADAGLKDAAVAQAEAALVEARASLVRTQQAGRPSEVAAQRARIASIAAQEEIARRDASRTDRLVVTGAGAAATAERNRFLLAQLAAQRAQAEADLTTLATARPEDVALAQSRVSAAEAAHGKARADAELARVRAPMDGTILRVFARPGDQVGSDGLLEMADLSRLDVVADVFETDLPRLRLGASAEIVIPGEAQRHAATVREIGWLVRRTTQAGTDPVAAVDARTVEVRLTLADEAAELLRRRSNMQVQVAIQPANPARGGAPGGRAMNELSPPPRLLPWAPELNGEAPHAASGEADATWSGRRPTGETAPGTGPAARAGEAPPEPGLLDWLRLPLRLAARQLRADRAKLATAIAGVMFAAVLVFMQLGFRSALFDSATALLSGMRADLFLIHPMTQASFRPEPLPRARAWQTLADAEVEQAVPIYLAQATLRHPTEGTRRAVQLIGLDAAAGAVAFTGLSSLTEPLTRPDTFAFDSRSRPEFGPLPRLFDERGPYEVQIGSRMLTLVGVVEIGPSFGADGNAVLSETNFRRVVSRNPAATDLVALRLKPGTDIAAVQARLRAMLPADVLVLTHAQLVAGERAYWENSTPIGFIFVFGSVMGLVVGMVIVYQILFADIAGHLGEYATLKAMGYSNGYLSRVVMGAALILALVGFVPGLGVSWLLYDFVGGATFLPLDMYPARAGMVFALILGMCVIAGLLAMRKLRDANPADMF